MSDRERFRAYLRLPRTSSYANRTAMRSQLRAGHGVDAKRTYPTGLDRAENFRTSNQRT